MVILIVSKIENRIKENLLKNLFRAVIKRDCSSEKPVEGKYSNNLPMPVNVAAMIRKHFDSETNIMQKASAQRKLLAQFSSFSSSFAHKF